MVAKETAKKPAKQIKFDEYKAIKDDIIEISEQRFENRLLLLEKRINENTDRKLEALNNDINQRFKIIFWILGIFITLYIATYSVLLNIVLNIKK